MTATVDFDARDFAERVYRREIFISDMIREADLHLLPVIFLSQLPAQGIKAVFDSLTESGTAIIYGKLSESFDQSIEGYPVFKEFHTLNSRERKAFFVEYTRLLKLHGHIKPASRLERFKRWLKR